MLQSDTGDEGSDLLAKVLSHGFQIVYLVRHKDWDMDQLYQGACKFAISSLEEGQALSGLPCGRRSAK